MSSEGPTIGQKEEAGPMDRLARLVCRRNHSQAEATRGYHRSLKGLGVRRPLAGGPGEKMYIPQLGPPPSHGKHDTRSRLLILLLRQKLFPPPPPPPKPFFFVGFATKAHNKALVNIWDRAFLGKEREIYMCVFR